MQRNTSLWSVFYLRRSWGTMQSKRSHASSALIVKVTIPTLTADLPHKRPAFDQILTTSYLSKSWLIFEKYSLFIMPGVNSSDGLRLISPRKNLITLNSSETQTCDFSSPHHQAKRTESKRRNCITKKLLTRRPCPPNRKHSIIITIMANRCPFPSHVVGSTLQSASFPPFPVEITRGGPKKHQLFGTLSFLSSHTYFLLETPSQQMNQHK